jgi:hypothetical protein
MRGELSDVFFVFGSLPRPRPGAPETHDRSNTKAKTPEPERMQRIAHRDNDAVRDATRAPVTLARPQRLLPARLPLPPSAAR